MWGFSERVDLGTCVNLQVEGVATVEARLMSFRLGPGPKP